MIDLHTHSSRSDGSDPPAAIPGLAAAAGCTAVALTDHDRLDGLDEAAGAARSVGIRLVEGCELSCTWAGGSCHVLAYFVGPGEGALQDELVRLQQDRAQRNEAMLAALGAAGVEITAEELDAEAGGSGAGRPHVAAILLRRGVVSSLQEAFDDWLTPGKPGYVRKARLGPGDAARLALASGGVAVLAHPHTLGLGPAGLEPALRELAELGLVGVEAHYARYTPEERLELARLAGRLDLVATGGSDYHGTYKPGLAVGTGLGDLHVPAGALEALEARRAD